MHTGFLGSWTANGLNRRVLERITSVLKDCAASGHDLTKIKVGRCPGHDAILCIA